MVKKDFEFDLLRQLRQHELLASSNYLQLRIFNVIKSLVFNLIIINAKDCTPIIPWMHRKAYKIQQKSDRKYKWARKNESVRTLNHKTIWTI